MDIALHCAYSQAKGGYRLVIVDGHDSDMNMELVGFCLASDIVAYGLPSHSTHLLQPLDVASLSRLQKSYGKQFFNSGIYWLQRGAFYPCWLKHDVRHALYPT